MTDLRAELVQKHCRRLHRTRRQPTRIFAGDNATVLRIGQYRSSSYLLTAVSRHTCTYDAKTWSAKFWLDPVALERAGGMSRAELNAVAKLINEHRDSLLEQWYEFFGR